jgi:nitrite reductase (NADH) large subunit
MGALEPELETDQVIQIIEENRSSYRKLIVRDRHLVGAMLVGNTAATAALVQVFDRDDPLPEDPLEILCQVRSSSAIERQICNCHKVTERTLREAIEAGADSIAACGETTKAGTGCGSCKADIGQLIASLKKPIPALEAAS